ncbi:MAG TPA: GNAT family N-acetyltransferase [Bryobacteraceae bacterium]|nr:GNAT family N-acetyltransferase [Bryobacteraceae bacterium]
MKRALKQFIFRVLGKDPEAIVVSFATGDPEVSRRMFAEIQKLEPGRRHVLVTAEEAGSGGAVSIYWRLRKRFRANRIGLAPVLFTGEPQYSPLRRAAFLVAPTKILAYNQRLERHHLRIFTAIASVLFLRGVPLDRIFLRPSWLAPWKRDRSVYPSEVREIAGRAMSARRWRIGIVSPYFPYPLSHGGAVRIFHLLREMAQEFDIFLFAFLDKETSEDFQPVLEYCARLILVGKPRYREPRWSTLLPPEVREFGSPAMLAALGRMRREYKLEAVQVEYTMLAPYRGDVLVEHDLTFALYRQVWKRTGKGWWDYWRWRRFEKKWIARYPKVAVMSERDSALLDRPNVAVIPNGVDLERFTPEIERPGHRLLFIGSFRHFPNVVAYRFFVEQVWPLLRAQLPQVTLTVVAGQDPLVYWREQTGLSAIPQDDGIRLLEFVADVRPLYVETNLVIVPTLVSAGTNLKVLEAMAMDRAVVSTFSGCAGLGLDHAVNVWIADTPRDFANAIQTLLGNRDLRELIAAAGRVHVERHFGWKQVGLRQRALLRELLPARVQVRTAIAGDIDQITAIQATAPEASQWLLRDYLTFDCRVALLDGRITGFVVSRGVADGEREILNVAVHPEFRRLGIATQLLQAEIVRWPGTHFLEVRESNSAARLLYQGLGFEVAGSRPGYYENPPEAGIVMRIFS